jgi:glycine cleavage system H protein
MSDNLEFRVDKFIFKVASDCYYSNEGVWAKLEDSYVRIGVSDYLQQRSGDVAFADVKPVGTVVAVGEEIAVIETIKVNISLSAPVAGKVVKVNPAMETAPEAINQDPYGEGWIALIEATEWENNLKNLMDPQDYYNKIKLEAEREINNK